MTTVTKRFLSAINYRGTFGTLAEIQALPEPRAGDRAELDSGTGFASTEYKYDAQEGWITSGNSGITEFHHSINFLSSVIQTSRVQGTPAWAGTITSIKATATTASATSLTFIAFKNGVELGTLILSAGDRIATATMSVTAATTDFFGASITDSGGDAIGVVFTFIFTKS